MAFNFGTSNINELGQTLSQKLEEYGIEEQNELTIYLNAEQFKLVDEDLFYRNRKNKEEEFIPSEGEINVNFNNIKMLIKNKG
jgi:hypothetical protein